MLQALVGFFSAVGVSLGWPATIVILMIMFGAASTKKLKYKITEVEKEDGKKEYNVYKYDDK